MPVTHQSGAILLPPVGEQSVDPNNAMLVSFSLRCHPGTVRSENQDRVLHGSTPLGELFIVADGVGGHANGGLAAEIAISTYLRTLAEESDAVDPREALLRTTQAVSTEIQQAQASDGAPGMASTVALVLLAGATAYIGHLGDSRVYLGRAGALSPLTRDHSVVQRMVDEGVISAEQSQSHPSSHVLTRCLGQADAELEVATTHISEEDMLLLCSDGLWACLPHEVVASTVKRHGDDVDAATAELERLALGAGASDNVSIVLLQFRASSANTGSATGYAEQHRGALLTRRKGIRIALIAAVALLLAAVLLAIVLYYMRARIPVGHAL
jgi:serine/threonine protein phosphatase PrpC